MQAFDSSSSGLKRISFAVAQHALEFMYSECHKHHQHGAILDLARSIWIKFPASTGEHHQMHLLAKDLVALGHGSHLLQLLRQPPSNLVSRTCTYLRARVESEANNVMSFTDPGLLEYLLDGLLDPVLFTHNLPVLISEVFLFFLLAFLCAVI